MRRVGRADPQRAAKRIGQRSVDDQHSAAVAVDDQLTLLVVAVQIEPSSSAGLEPQVANGCERLRADLDRARVVEHLHARRRAAVAEADDPCTVDSARRVDVGIDVDFGHAGQQRELAAVFDRQQIGIESARLRRSLDGDRCPYRSVGHAVDQRQSGRGFVDEDQVAPVVNVCPVADRQPIDPRRVAADDARPIRTAVEHRDIAIAGHSTGVPVADLVPVDRYAAKTVIDHLAAATRRDRQQNDHRNENVCQNARQHCSFPLMCACAVIELLATTSCYAKTHVIAQVRTADRRVYARSFTPTCKFSPSGRLHVSSVCSTPTSQGMYIVCKTRAPKPGKNTARGTTFEFGEPGGTGDTTRCRSPMDRSVRVAAKARDCAPARITPRRSRTTLTVDARNSKNSSKCVLPLTNDLRGRLRTYLAKCETERRRVREDRLWPSMRRSRYDRSVRAPGHERLGGGGGAGWRLARGRL